MPNHIISSSENETIKAFAKLKTRKYREAFSQFIIEGERSVKDALLSGFPLVSLVMTEAFFKAHGEEFSPKSVIVTTEKIFSLLSDTKTPQGILAIGKIPPKRDTLTGKRYIYCDCIQDPGNAGTIIRSADAFGFDGVIFSKGSVDAFSPKVIRSSMGSVFHIDVFTEKEPAFLEQAKREGFFLSVTALHKESVTLFNMKKTERQIFVIGNEGSGASEEVLALADETVFISMRGKAESLNAGVAASVLAYEVMRDE